MEQFMMEIDEPTRLYEMRPIRDPKTDEYLIYFSRMQKSGIKSSIDFNGGELLIGLDEERTIALVQLDRPKRTWTKLELKGVHPTSVRRGRIRLPAMQAHNNEFDLPVDVQSDDAKSFALVSFDVVLDDRTVVEWIEIAPQCLAMVIGEQLHGFWMDLST